MRVYLSRWNGSVLEAGMVALLRKISVKTQMGHSRLQLAAYFYNRVGGPGRQLPGQPHSMNKSLFRLTLHYRHHLFNFIMKLRKTQYPLMTVLLLIIPLHMSHHRPARAPVRIGLLGLYRLLPALLRNLQRLDHLLDLLYPGGLEIHVETLLLALHKAKMPRTRRQPINAN